MESIRTRFAPSPTGFLHIGGARTALYNWAYTRRVGGRFVLRIEDTDRERSTAESEAAVLGGLEWLGIDWDEGPFRQSERGDLHRAAIEQLLASDRAYRCICTPAEIEERRAATVATGAKWTYDGRCADANHGPGCGPHAVRLRVPKEGMLGFDDLVFGPSGQDARELGDMVIRRSDGSPLYHLAVVVDDVDMGITHVIRGADHLNNTPFQLALYRALDATPPRFAHVPLIVGANGKKLSKRRDPVSVQHFRAAGYLPEAMCNWLVRIGWSHGDQEIFSRDEIRALFDLPEVHRAAGQADPGKLDWLNQHYIKEMPGERLVRALLPFLAEAGTPVEPTPALESVADLLRERSKTLVEMAQRARFFAIAEAAWTTTPTPYANTGRPPPLRRCAISPPSLPARRRGISGRSKRRSTRYSRDTAGSRSENSRNRSGSPSPVRRLRLGSSRRCSCWAASAASRDSSARSPSCRRRDPTAA